MYKDGKLWIALGENKICLEPSMANRHGLITGASGTGKTVTLKVMAESLSDMGVPVFLQDVKGDVSGLLVPGADSESMQKRIARFGIDDWSYGTYPTRFWDVYGEKGIPVRGTVSDMGPALLSRLLGLNAVQESVLTMAFKIADDNGMLLIDIKDLRAMLNFVAAHRDAFESDYGAVSPVSVTTINRYLLKLEDEGGNAFFGEPDLDIFDWIRTNHEGRGYINLLHSVRLVQDPVLYATFMLWMLSEVYEKLPEVGDLEKPRMVFFFDEAHLLFSNTPAELRRKIVQVVKLVRSKGVGVYFITQSPSDIPDDVLAQLSNRVQHALRAYTPAEQKAVRAAASAFRTNPAFRTEDVITELGTGEALISFLDEKGAPSVVQRAFVLPPRSFMGPAPDDLIERTVMADEFELKYRNAVDRESAYEAIGELNAHEEAMKQKAAEEKEAEKAAAAQAKVAAMEAKAAEKQAAKEAAAAQKKKNALFNRIAGNVGSTVARSAGNNLAKSVLGNNSSSLAGKVIKSAISTTSSSIGREAGKSLLRGILGSLK